MSAMHNRENITYDSHASDRVFTVYQQLSEERKGDSGSIKDMLFTVFAIDPYTAYV